jgi:hypothetical protein
VRYVEYGREIDYPQVTSISDAQGPPLIPALRAAPALSPDSAASRAEAGGRPRAEPAVGQTRSDHRHIADHSSVVRVDF